MSGLIPRYVTVLVFSRDLGILLIATLLFATGTLRDFVPSLFGKLNTATQILAVVVIFCRQMTGWAKSVHWPGQALLRLIAVLAPTLGRAVCVDRATADKRGARQAR